MRKGTTHQRKRQHAPSPNQRGCRAMRAPFGTRWRPNQRHPSYVASGLAQVAARCCLVGSVIPSVSPRRRRANILLLAQAARCQPIQALRPAYTFSGATASGGAAVYTHIYRGQARLGRRQSHGKGNSGEARAGTVLTGNKQQQRQRPPEAPRERRQTTGGHSSAPNGWLARVSLAPTAISRTASTCCRLTRRPLP